MDILTIILLSVVILLAAALFYTLNRTRNNQSRDIDNAALRQQAEYQYLQFERRMDALQARHEQQFEKIRMEYEQARRFSEQNNEKYMENLRRESTAQFQALASEILKSQSAGLKEQNAEHIEALLRPLAENIEGFRKAVTDSYVQENASRKSLTDQIDRLMKLNESIGTEARNLTSALKGNSKVQGDWGEMILETMLENAGLERGIHFEAQVTRSSDGRSIQDEEGHRQRPDIVVNMPDNRKLVIDSKVSLTAFAELCSEEDEARRKTLHANHLASVKRHINELAAKKYQDSINGSADHVMMFIPNEGAYIAAVQQDPELWLYAYTRHVALVSPTHLFSSMRIVSQLWVQDKQNRNTIEIARKGGALYDKVVLFLNSMQEIGAALDKAKDSYETALSRLTTGRGSVTKLSSDLKNLGAKASKNMPESVVSRIDCDPIDENGELQT